MNYDYFATTAKGLETVLAEEIAELGGAEKIEKQTGGVAFCGSRELAYKANLWLRTAVRVLLRIAKFQAKSPEQLYEHIREIDWTAYLSLEKTFAVQANARDSEMRHSQYIALKTKDAIVDQFRDRFGKRPNVSRDAPDLLINIHLKNNLCTVSLDMSGESLHKRGYRLEGGQAPMREWLAAGILRLAKYDGTTSFTDLMCGSGTLPVEAAMVARKMPPGILRKKFGFQTWPDFDAKAWEKIQHEARTQMLPHSPVPIFASDTYPRILTIAAQNARRAGVEKDIQFKRQDFLNARPQSRSGVVFCNPPYGERIGDVDDLAETYKNIGEVYKRNFQGHTGLVFTGNLDLGKCIRLKPKRRHILFNGPIESRLLIYELY